jgi:RNA polymerase sigma factor (sigma-70 family)
MTRYTRPRTQKRGTGDGHESASLEGTAAGSCPDDVLASWLRELAAGKDGARERILEFCDGRLRELAHRLLGEFATVRRWDGTDDVAQNAALRLYRALGETVPDSPRGLMGLMATVIERELIDLARKHAGPLSYAANHGTNVTENTGGNIAFVVDEAADENGAGEGEAVPIERWEMFHQAVEKLPPEYRELFRLVWYVGVDQESAAKALGMSLRTVERRWQEARGMVAEMLDGHDGRAHE